MSSPQVEARCRGGYLKSATENVQYRVEFFPVQGPVRFHVGFIIPGCDAGQLMMHRHGAAVVGAVAQETLEDFAVTATKPERSPGRLERLDRE